MLLTAEVSAEAEYKYRPFRRLWNSLAFVDPAVMNLTLANAAIWKRQATGSIGHSLEFTDYPESVRYYGRSLSRLLDRLNDQSDQISEGVIGGVLGLACHDVCTSDTLHQISVLKSFSRLRSETGSVGPTTQTASR